MRAGPTGPGPSGWWSSDSPGAAALQRRVPVPGPPETGGPEPSQLLLVETGTICSRLVSPAEPEAGWTPLLGCCWLRRQLLQAGPQLLGYSWRFHTHTRNFRWFLKQPLLFLVHLTTTSRVNCWMGQVKECKGHFLSGLPVWTSLTGQTGLRRKLLPLKLVVIPSTSVFRLFCCC